LNQESLFMPLFLNWLKRLLLAVPTVLAVSMLGFLLMRFHVVLGPITLPNPQAGQPAIVLMPKIDLKQPIDPLAELRQNPQISPEALAKEEKRLALDKPMWQQYWQWLTHALRLDFGKTFKGEDVVWLLGNRAKNTVLLNVVVITASWLLAIPLGILGALAAGTWLDRSLTVGASVLLAAPSFLIALGMAVLAVKTGWFPLGGLQSPQASLWPWPQQVGDIALHLVLPAATLTLGGMASLQRQMRANLLDVLQAPYVKNAEARGLPRWRVILRHALRNALNPLITLLGFEFAALLSGALLVETVLGFPGLGFLTYQAVLQGDTNLVMCTLVLSCIMLVLGNLIADSLLQVLDPRVRA
jgi:peptide/nickel transport system permease protein